MSVPAIALYASPPSGVCPTPHHSCQIPSSHGPSDFDLNTRPPSSSAAPSSSGQKPIVGGLSRLFSSPPSRHAASSAASSSFIGADEFGSLRHDRSEDLSSSFCYSSYPSSSFKCRDQSPVSVFQDARAVLIKLADRLHNMMTLEALPKGEGVSYHALSGRHKGLYSIYSKMLKKNLTMDEIHDIHGLRLIVENEEDCYMALNVVHRLWPEVLGRFKDYIAHPKFNGYAIERLRSELRRCIYKLNMELLLIGDTKKVIVNTLHWCSKWWNGRDGRCNYDGPIFIIILENEKMSVQEFPANSTVTDLLERAGGGSSRSPPYTFSLREDLRPRLNHEPVSNPCQKLKMGDVVELTPSIPDKSLTEYREEIQRMYELGLSRAGMGPVSCSGSGSARSPPLVRTTREWCSGDWRVGKDRIFSGFVRNALGSCLDFNSPSVPLPGGAQSRHKIFYEEFVVKAFYEAEKAHRGQIFGAGVADLVEGVDLVGGYYDAGDNVKHGLPMAFTITTLAWSAIAYQSELQTTRELKNVHAAIRWGTDYFLKASIKSNSSWVQDELLWAASWLCMATKLDHYLKYITEEAITASVAEFSWDIKYAGAQVLLSDMDYILDSNPRGRFYMVGFGTNPPMQPHHHGASVLVLPSDTQVDCVMSFANWYQKDQPNPNELTGAIVGGPDRYNNFDDKRSDSSKLEPCTCINSLAVGPLAKLAVHGA
ncbi:hypothetical protein COCNU_scaffold021348G000010 [Cocos nucifera]|nr:hypothetical protein [Cocos nucifera]